MKLSERIRKAWNAWEDKDLPTWWCEAEILEDRVAELEAQVSAAKRIIQNDYTPFYLAGGLANECIHGYANGIPCPDCDRITLGIN